MNWRLMETIELLTFFLGTPVVSFVIAYRGWKEGPENLNLGSTVRFCLASGAAALLLGWLGGKPIPPQMIWYFLHLACFVLFCGSIGAVMGYCSHLMLSMWHWHQVTRLKR